MRTVLEVVCGVLVLGATLGLVIALCSVLTP